jgi:intracellular septation protein
MKLIFDFFPLVLFFAAYKFYDIYVATAAAIVASILQVVFFWFRQHRFETTHLITLAVVVTFGGMTLIFKDALFIKWKPTIVEWIFSAIILGSNFRGRKTAMEYLLGKQLSLPPPVWRKVNLAWGLFFLFVGTLNIYVAFYFRPDLTDQARTDLWVNFKVFGLMGLTLVFAVGQMLMIAKYIDTDKKDDA